MSLIEHAKSLFTTSRDIMQAKNTDYSGASSDPFSNFRSAKVLGIEPEIGLMMRVMDKSKRIQSFLANGKMAVVSEPVDDAIADKLNYYVLLTGLLSERFRGLYHTCTSRARLVLLHEKLERHVLSELKESDYQAMLLEASVDGLDPLLGELRSIRQGFSTISRVLNMPVMKNANGAILDPEPGDEGFIAHVVDPVTDALHSGLKSVVLMHYHVNKCREDAARDTALAAELTAFTNTPPIPLADVGLAAKEAKPLAPAAPPVPPLPNL